MSEPCGFCEHPRYAHRVKMVHPHGREYWPCRSYECRCTDYAWAGTVTTVSITDNGNTP